MLFPDGNFCVSCREELRPPAGGPGIHHCSHKRSALVSHLLIAARLDQTAEFKTCVPLSRSGRLFVERQDGHGRRIRKGFGPEFV